MKQMEKQMAADKSSKQYQRLRWEKLRKGLNGIVNKVNVANVKELVPDIFDYNLVRGTGLFCRAIMKAQLASPGFTHIYTALLAVVNTRMPEIGELLVSRVVLQFRRSYKRNDKVRAARSPAGEGARLPAHSHARAHTHSHTLVSWRGVQVVATALAKFIAHLVNYQIVHEILALQVLALLLETPTEDSVEVAVSFVKECGQMLSELTPEGLRGVFERFRGILQEGQINKKAQYTIEGLFAVYKSGFADYPSVHPELDLVDSADQITHDVGLTDKVDKKEHLGA